MSDWSDFGSLLRSTRSKLGWSLQDVAHRTRIPLATLRQLEGNDYSHFPSLSYAKSFLAQYSEHLGVDAAEWLDNFDTGDALANLDSYEYLKDHDDHLEAGPVVIKRDKPKKQKIQKEKPERRTRSSRRATLQPLLVFSVTALLITGAVFGFMKLSAKFSEDATDSAAEKTSEEYLAPVAGNPDARPAPRDFSNVPGALPVTSETLVAGDPGGTLGAETLNATPSTKEDIPDNFDIENSPPPRAVIVEE